MNKPWEKILAIVSISLTDLVTKRPIAVLSKYAILKFIILSNNLSLRSFITL